MTVRGFSWRSALSSTTYSLHCSFFLDLPFGILSLNWLKELQLRVALGPSRGGPNARPKRLATKSKSWT